LLYHKKTVPFKTRKTTTLITICQAAFYFQKLPGYSLIRKKPQILVAGNLVCQTGSALCSSGSQNLPAILSVHSFTKTMLLFSVELLRLISPFH